MSLFSLPHLSLKQPLFFLTAAFVFGMAACQPKEAPASVQLKRDKTITEANAYSDLFFDSTQMENYIKDSRWHD